MNGRTGPYALVVTTQASNRHEDSEAVCAILVDLIQVPSPLYLDDIQDLHMLSLAPSVLPSVLKSAIAEGYACAPYALGANSDLLARELRSPADVDDWVARLREAQERSAVLPLDIWLCPKHEERAVGAIDLFYAIGRDNATFDRAIALGAMRLALADASVTVSVRCGEIRRAKAWCQGAAASTGYEIRRYPSEDEP